MLRVLMVLEDYGELMFLQTVLKKIGFDVDAIQTTRNLGDSVLTMNPDVLVMTAFGKRVRGADLAPSVRRVRGLPKIILIRHSQSATSQIPEVDGWLEAPVSALGMVMMIADLSGLNTQMLTEKFQKIHMPELESEKTRLLQPTETDTTTLDVAATSSGNFGRLASSTLSNSERQDRYAQFLNEAPPPQHGYSVKEISERVKDLRQKENSANLEDLERERRAFVEHLFRKK